MKVEEYENKNLNGIIFNKVLCDVFQFIKMTNL